MNEIVKYDNQMNSLKFKNFTTIDLNMLMALCSKMKNIGDEKITFSFEELRTLTNYQQTSNKKFLEDLDRMNKKLMQVTCNFKTETESIMFVLFPTFRTNYETQQLTVSVNTEFAFLLNEITDNFTRFELAEFVKLNSKYSKNFYRLLKQYRTTGFYKVGVEDFRDKMDCPSSYSNRQFMQNIIEPTVAELSTYFENLKCEPIYARKRGKPVIGYEFHFGREVVNNQIPGQINIKNLEDGKYMPNKKTSKPKNKFTKTCTSRNYNFDTLEKELLKKELKK